MHDTITWRASDRTLVLSDAIVTHLDLDTHVGLSTGADGALLVRGPHALGSAYVMPVHHGGWFGDTRDEDLPPHVHLGSAIAAELQLPVTDATYMAWYDHEAIYALPMQAPTITLTLTLASYQALEAIALRHGGRARDILTAFAEDLSAAHTPYPERWSLPSGGSDERDLADQWFRRNVDPGGWGGPSGNQPQFMRTHAETRTRLPVPKEQL